MRSASVFLYELWQKSRKTIEKSKDKSECLFAELLSVAATFTDICINKQNTIKSKNKWKFLTWNVLKYFRKRFNIIKIFITKWFKNQRIFLKTLSKSGSNVSSELCYAEIYSNKILNNQRQIHCHWHMLKNWRKKEDMRFPKSRETACLVS